MVQPSDAEYTTSAAQITAAMLRFDIERLPPNKLTLPHDNPGRLGEVAFFFLPRHELVSDADLVHHLAALPKPVIIGALAQKGLIATWWPTSFDARALAVWEHTLANQQRAVASGLTERRLADDDLILLQTTVETLLFPPAALRRWADMYGVHIGWTLTDNAGDAQAQARLHLIRGDGGHTPGHSCGTPA
jgi:hypothetical protein